MPNRAMKVLDSLGSKRRVDDSIDMDSFVITVLFVTMASSASGLSVANLSLIFFSDSDVIDTETRYRDVSVSEFIEERILRSL